MSINDSIKHIQDNVRKLLQGYPRVMDIIQAIHAVQGEAYLVGGSVRDLILELPIKDLDIEVHKLPLKKLEAVLQQFGIVNTVGKSFGVLKIEKINIDWSLPRTDESGRRPDVTLDPWMDIKKAFERRDLTMNAMGIHLGTFQLVDPFNGLEDIKKKVLRSPNPAFFSEDPLRFYRVMQFIARFDMKPDITLTNLCSVMDISSVSHERIESEYKKWLLQSAKPSLALQWIDDINRLEEVMPEIATTKGILQEPDWHPEGDVFEHTKQTIDAAAYQDYRSDEEKLIIMYASLCHDVGKSVTTRLNKGRLTAYDHPQQGVFLTKRFLKRFTHAKDLIVAVTKLVDAHLYPVQFVDNHAGLSAYKRLALKLAPEVTIAMLAKVALADKQGRNKMRGTPLRTPQPAIDQFLKKAQQANVLTAIEIPVLQGKDLMPEIEPGPTMGLLVKEAYALQLNEGIQDKETLKKMILAQYYATKK